MENQFQQAGRFARRAAVVIAFLSALGPAALANPPAPTDCIKSFMIAVYNAKSLNQVEQYFCKNQRDSFRTMSVPDRNKKLNEFKTYYLGNAKYSNEQVTGDKAKVDAKGIGYQPSIKKNVNQSETFELAKEGNYWRIEGARLSATFKVH